VDYESRRQLFESLQGWNESDQAFKSSLLQTPEEDRAKLHLVSKTLSLRQQHPELFQAGEYLPIKVEGAKADHLVAFARKSESTAVLVVVPRLIATLLKDADAPPTGDGIWGDTRLVLPFCECQDKYRNVLTGEVLDMAEPLLASRALADFPVALCLLL